MTTVKMAIPRDFILGAAASAWQTEGWSGKKAGQDSWPDLWYRTTAASGITATARRWRPILSTASAKTCS